MTNCSKCGSPRAANDRFCSSCGASTAAASAPQPEPVNGPSPPPSLFQAFKSAPAPNPAAPPDPVAPAPNPVAPAPNPVPLAPNPVVPPPDPVASVPNPVAPGPDLGAPRPSVGSLAQISATGWLLCGGAAAIVIASFLPWSQASALGITFSSKPSSGAPALLMILAAVALGLGWPGVRGTLSKRRLVGVAIVAGVLSIFVVTNWSDLSKLQSDNPSANISGGSGLYLYTAGVVALWVCAVRVLLAWRRSPIAR